MIRFFAALLTFAFLTLPLRPGLANMAPPPEDCKRKKAGDACETYWDTKGTCRLTCPYPNPLDCEREDQKILTCVAPEKSAEPNDNGTNAK